MRRGLGALRIAAGATLLAACGGDSTSGAATSSGAPAQGPQVPVGSAYPASYTIVYQVTQNGTQQWEVVSVQRPFAATDLTYATSAAPHAGDRPASGNMSTADALYVVDAKGARLVSARQPGPPSGDQFVGAEVAELTRRGLAADLASSATIAGRACETYRFAGPLTGAIPALGAQSDHDDVCIDADGLELSETWTYKGRVVLQRVAVNVSSSAQPATDTSGPAPPSIAPTSPGPFAATVAPDSQPASFITSPPQPEGFQPSGPAVDFRFPDRQNPAQTAAASVVWTFVNGARVITVEAGREAGGALPWKDGDTVAEGIVLNGLGPAMTAVRSDGFELRIDLGGGQWVRVHGTVPLDQLVAFGHRLSRAAAAPTAG
jgi:hypothetical protein